MNINIKRTEIYIPKLDGNEKENNPVKIKLKYLTAGETADVREYIPAVKNSKGKIIKPATFAYDTEKMIEYMVIGIENLTVTADGKVTQIKTGKDLINSPGLDVLYAELYLELIGMDARVDTKN